MIFQNGYEEKWQRDGVSVDIFSSVVANGKHTLAVWIEAKPYFCSYQIEGWRIILTCLSPTSPNSHICTYTHAAKSPFRKRIDA